MLHVLRFPWRYGLVFGCVLLSGSWWLLQAQQKPGPALNGFQDRDRDQFRDREGERDRFRYGQFKRSEVVVGQGIMLLISPDQRNIAAYSKHTGTWKRLDLGEPHRQNLTPIISELVAIVQVGHDVYGYSARTGSWDRTRLEAHDGDVVVENDWAHVFAGRRAHAFSAHSGKWESIEVR